MTYDIEHRTLHFKQPAGTSRGVYHTRDVWYIHLYEGGWHGIGECAPLPDLSCDALPQQEYEQHIQEACHSFCKTGQIPYDSLRSYPSILFGLESATMPDVRLEDDKENPICRINGLIWMGTYEEMKERLEEKLRVGFRCIKLKIGAINFEDEMRLIQQVRKDFPQEVVELRVDANGGLGTPTDLASVHAKLQRLASHHLHSIEQPIPAGHWEQMAQLCQESPLPIALDEELIGINHTANKIDLLDTIRPQYIILKPSLHGGLSGCDEWIRLAKERGIGWWATSALESNIGLAAIAQWVQNYQPVLPQGLGTGLLFTDNTEPRTVVRGEELWWI